MAIVGIIKVLSLQTKAIHIVSQRGMTGFDSVQKWCVSVQSNDGYAL